MGFLDQSFRLFQAWRIDVRIHILFVIWMGFRLMSAGPAWRDELTFVAMLFGIVLLHEFGHCIGARLVGGDAREILLWPLGGLAFAAAPMRPWPQFVTVACGPLVNVLLCIAAGAALMVATGRIDAVSINPYSAVNWGALDPRAAWQGYVGVFYYVNLLLLCFNLLPVFPLDGGQLFRSIIWPFIGLSRATVLAAQFGVGGALVLGVWGAMNSQFLLIAIAIFGGFTSFQQLMAARYGYLVEDPPPRPRPDQSGWWSRLWRRSGAQPGARVSSGTPRASRATGVAVGGRNPNPGAWEERLEEERRLQEDVDRILKKFHEQGAQSLTYVERQALERATRELQRREKERERGA